MNDLYRLFAYITGSVVFGLIIILFTRMFFEYVNEPGATGYITLTGYGLVYLNFSYIVNKRFTKKREHPSNVSYLLAALIAVPALVWVFSKETALDETRLVFVLTILFAVFLGAYYGIRAGIRKRKAYLAQKRNEMNG